VTLLVTRPREQYLPDALAGIGVDARGRLRAAAWLAQLAYEDDVDKIDDIAADWSLHRRLSLPPLVIDVPWRAETRLHILQGHGLTIITFCGTDPLRFANWITDLRIRQSADGSHSGFVAALDAAWPHIAPSLRGLREPLWIVGHSLGAALAVHCALRARQSLNITAHAVIGFGMPRVGGEIFAARYEPLLGAQTVRAVHGEDVVARLPPPDFGYQHVGRRISCAAGGQFDPAQTQSTSDNEPRIAARLADAAAALLAAVAAGPISETLRDDPLGLASTLLPPLIADHLPDRYCTACT
jgi:pimeloyl-ACP methyl ester carboxylesterase